MVVCHHLTAKEERSSRLLILLPATCRGGDKSNDLSMFCHCPRLLQTWTRRVVVMPANSWDLDALLLFHF